MYIGKGWKAIMRLKAEKLLPVGPIPDDFRIVPVNLLTSGGQKLELDLPIQLARRMIGQMAGVIEANSHMADMVAPEALQEPVLYQVANIHAQELSIEKLGAEGLEEAGWVVVDHDPHYLLTVSAKNGATAKLGFDEEVLKTLRREIDEALVEKPVSAGPTSVQ